MFWLEETKTDDGSEFERAFRGAVQFALNKGFFFFNILELKPVQEEALLHFIKRKDVFAVLQTGCHKSLIFQIGPRVCANLHDRGFNFSKAVVSVVVSLRTADVFPVVASLPPKNSVCEPERQNDFRDVKPF